MAVFIEPVHVLCIAVGETVGVAERVAYDDPLFQVPGVADIKPLPPLREKLKGAGHADPAGAQSHTVGGDHHVLAANSEVKGRSADAALVHKEQDHRRGAPEELKLAFAAPFSLTIVSTISLLRYTLFRVNAFY